MIGPHPNVTAVGARATAEEIPMFRTARGLLLCGASVLSVAVFAQDSAQMDSNSTSTAGLSRDKAFLMKAAEGGITEVQLGRLAAQKATNPDVKAFGQKMVDDHTALNEQMKPIAMRMKVKTSEAMNSKHSDMFEKMNTMPAGPEWDKMYLKAMVADHHKDLKEFSAEADHAKDPELKAAVMKGRDVIQEHTSMVEKLAQDNGVMVKKSGASSSNSAQ